MKMLGLLFLESDDETLLNTFMRYLWTILFFWIELKRPLIPLRKSISLPYKILIPRNNLYFVIPLSIQRWLYRCEVRQGAIFQL
ncbi:MAG: hypothetical protein MRK02_15625 [Candidatus Scalindua sp.]|nr:hypothetical protein [Candidatus Scalindua sp.]